jgi:hypothetical protein
MNSELKQRIQVVMVVALLVSGGRLAYILYERHQDQMVQSKVAPPLKADYYVTPKKFYLYDLKSARTELTKQPVWVQVGYANIYYPYDPVGHYTNFSREAGKLLPIEKLQIQNVITDVAPSAPGEPQVMAVFKKDGKEYAFAIGSVKGGEYKFYADQMLFREDPHELYKHWPAEVWAAVDQHEVKPGMGELQADFAVGLGIPESGEPGNRTVNYPNGGNPLKVTYQNDKATEINPGSR